MVRRGIILESGNKICTSSRDSFRDWTWHGASVCEVAVALLWRRAHNWVECNPLLESTHSTSIDSRISFHEGPAGNRCTCRDCNIIDEPLSTPSSTY